MTSAEMTLASPSAGEAIHLENRYRRHDQHERRRLSPDLMNRALPIHLAPKGDVHEQETPIGNPKLDYLPAKQDQIEAELRGMIERGKWLVVRWMKALGTRCRLGRRPSAAF